MRFHRLYSRLSFVHKISLGLAVIVIAFGLVTALAASQAASRSIRDESQRRGASMARGLSARTAEYVLTLDLLRLNEAVKQYLALDASIAYVFIQDADGTVLAHGFEGGFPTRLAGIHPSRAQETNRLLSIDGLLVDDFQAPIDVGDFQVGVARLGFSRSEAARTSRQLLVLIFGVTGAAAIGSLAVGTLFASATAARINLLRRSAEAMVRGDLNILTGQPISPKCHEIMNCRIERCPSRDSDRLRCWYMAGDLREGGENSCAFLSDGQLTSCRDCPVYRRHKGDELESLAEAFDAMACTVKEQIEQLTASERTLARQRQLLRTIFDVTPDLVALLDLDLRFQTVNKAFKTYYGRSEEETIGKTGAEFLSAERSDGLFGWDQSEEREVLATGKPASKQVLVQGEGGRRWFHVIKTPVREFHPREAALDPESRSDAPKQADRDGRGKIIGLLVTGRDITVLKTFQEQLVQSQKMEDLGKLAGGVAHEINTPLGVILGYSQLLLEDAPAGSPLAEDLRIIERQTKACRKIVSDLLEFSRHVESERTEMDLNQSLREVISLVEAIFRQERVRVEFEPDDDLPPITGDRDKLRQVWMNLLNNAFDAVLAHNPRGGWIAVATKLCEKRGRIVVSVTDTGVGIEPETMRKIFDPFFSTKPVGKGTGLGLSVTFGIVQDHGGRITALSPAPLEYLPEETDAARERGPGATFFVELPIDGGSLPDESCPEVSRALDEARKNVLPDQEIPG